MNRIIFVFGIFILLINVVYASDNSIGEIVWVEGNVKLEYPAKSPVDAKIGMFVLVDATISTEDNSKAVIKLSDGTILSIAPKTKILIESLLKSIDKREASVVTFVGKIRAVVKKQLNSKSKFEFKSKTAIAGVRGTHLAMEVAEDGTTRVFLINGFVGVFNREKMDLPEIMLSEGTFSEIREGAAPTPPQPIPPEVMQDIYNNTSIMAMIKNELNKNILKTNVMPETKILEGNFEEKLIVSLREFNRENLERKSSYSQSLIEPLREQDIQGIVVPKDFVGEINTKSVNVDVLININNY